MYAELTNELKDNTSFEPMQLLLPSNRRIEPYDIKGRRFTDSQWRNYLRKEPLKTGLTVYLASVQASQILTTLTRTDEVTGGSLRNAHHRIGYHLAIEYVSRCLGVGEFAISNTRQQTDHGHCLWHECRTVIVPLMRGGEPMTFGVSEAFPRAVFAHANTPGELNENMLKTHDAVILVDAVVNTGKSIREFVEHIASVNPNIEIVPWHGSESPTPSCSGPSSPHRRSMTLRINFVIGWRPLSDHGSAVSGSCRKLRCHEKSNSRSNPMSQSCLTSC